MSYVSLGWTPGGVIEGLKASATKSEEASSEGGPGFFSKFKGVTSSIGKGVAAAGKAATEAPQEDSWLSKGLSFLSKTSLPAAQAASKATGRAKAQTQPRYNLGFIVPVGIGAALLLYLMMSRK